MIKFSISLIALLSLVSCETKQVTETLITVDVARTYPQREFILQELFDVEYVPLETNDDFLTTGNIQAIGREYIVVKNNGRTDGNFYLFKRDGKGICRINRLGQGGEEYLNILAITLDEEQGELYVNSHYAGMIYVYDLEGNFKRSFKQPANFYDLVGIYDQNYLICHDGWEEFERLEPKRNLFMLVSKADGTIKEIPINYTGEAINATVLTKDANGRIISDWSIRNKQLIPYADGWLLMTPGADTLYTISSAKGLEPFMVRTPSVQEMNPEVFLFPSVITDRYAFMQTTKKSFRKGIDKDVPRVNLVYDREMDECYECKVYNADFQTSEPMNLWFDHMVLQTFNNDEIAFAIRLEALALVEANQAGKLQGCLKEIAATLDEEDNPVIMIAKHKK